MKHTYKYPEISNNQIKQIENHKNKILFVKGTNEIFSIKDFKTEPKTEKYGLFNTKLKITVCLTELRLVRVVENERYIFTYNDMDNSADWVILTHWANVFDISQLRSDWIRLKSTIEGFDYKLKKIEDETK